MPRGLSRRVFLSALAVGGVYLALRRWSGLDRHPPRPSQTPTPSLTPSATPSPPSPSPIREEGLYSIDNWPGLEWHMFSDTSVWNTPLDKSKVDPNSAVMIRTLMSDG